MIGYDDKDLLKRVSSPHKLLILENHPSINVYNSNG